MLLKHLYKSIYKPQEYMLVLLPLEETLRSHFLRSPSLFVRGKFSLEGVLRLKII